jgi:AcrR family transcriptional regulator
LALFEILWAALSSRDLPTARPFIAPSQDATHALAAQTRWRALHSLPLNDSFIQLFELQLRKPRETAMPSDQTRSAILAAAERLYADRGFGDVTLRDIVAAASVNLAAVNYHFGSKDELIAELFVTRSLATNRERLKELKAAEEEGGGSAAIDDILRALVGPTLRGCLGPERERSTAARFMIRASIESVPPIRRIKNREVDHLRKFAAAMRRSLPDRSEVELYWGLHFALAMAHHTIRESERLAKLSEGLCDLDDVDRIIERVVAVSVMALTAGDKAGRSSVPTAAVRAPASANRV